MGLDPCEGVPWALAKRTGGAGCPETCARPRAGIRRCLGLILLEGAQVDNGLRLLGRGVRKSMSVFGISSRRGLLWPPYCQLGRGFAATSNVVSSVAWQRPDYGRTMVSICWRRPIRLENRMAKSATLSLASYLGLVPPRLQLPDSARSIMRKQLIRPRSRIARTPGKGEVTTKVPCRSMRGW